MRRKHYAVLLFLSMIASISYASFPQDIQACLYIDGNTTPFKFRVGFVSSDIFDGWKNSGFMFNGSTCITHTYHQGPKNIKLHVGIAESNARSDNAEDNLIILDRSCSFLTNIKNALVQTPEYTRTGAAHHYWEFSLTQIPPSNGFKYTYALKCKTWSE